MYVHVANISNNSDQELPIHNHTQSHKLYSQQKPSCKIGNQKNRKKVIHMKHLPFALHFPRSPFPWAQFWPFRNKVSKFCLVNVYKHARWSSRDVCAVFLTMKKEGRRSRMRESHVKQDLAMSPSSSTGLSPDKQERLRTAKQKGQFMQPPKHQNHPNAEEFFARTSPRKH
jgi:hypothetical protein